MQGLTNTQIIVEAIINKRINTMIDNCNDAIDALRDLNVKVIGLGRHGQCPVITVQNTPALSKLESAVVAMNLHDQNSKYNKRSTVMHGCIVEWVERGH